MRINKIDTNTFEQYDNLAHTSGPVFCTTDWLALFDEQVHPYGIFNKNDELIGGFTLFSVNRLGLKIYRNPPFTPMIGPFIKIESQHPVSINSTWKDVLSAMVDFFDGLSYSIISLYLSTEIKDTQPFYWNKYKVIPHFTYIIDLNQEEDVLFQNMSKNYRKHIRRAQQKDLEVRQIYDMNIVKDLVLKTFSKKDAQLNQSMMESILFQFSNNANSFAIATFKDNTPIAATFCVYDHSTCYALLGGHDPEQKENSAGVLTRWRAIQQAKSLGLQQFDFEGSMLPNIEVFYRGFGGQLAPIFAINKAKLPYEIALKFIKRNTY